MDPSVRSSVLRLTCPRPCTFFSMDHVAHYWIRVLLLQLCTPFSRGVGANAWKIENRTGATNFYKCRNGIAGRDERALWTRLTPSFREFRVANNTERRHRLDDNSGRLRHGRMPRKTVTRSLLQWSTTVFVSFGAEMSVTSRLRRRYANANEKTTVFFLLLRLDTPNSIQIAVGKPCQDGRRAKGKRLRR